MIIDVHSHILNAILYPREVYFNRMAISKHKASYALYLPNCLINLIDKITNKRFLWVKDLFDDSISEYIDHMKNAMKKAGIDQAYILLIDFEMDWSKEIIPLLKQDDAFKVFAGYSPGKPIPKGVDGYKIYPPLGFDPSSKDMYKLYEYCSYYRKPIVTHSSPGGIKGKGVMHPEYLSHPDRWWDVLNDFPMLKVDFAHFGGNSNFIDHFLYDKDNRTSSIVKLMMEFENVYADIAFHDGVFDNYKEWSRAARVAVDNPFVKLMFGTDFPLNEAFYDIKKFTKRVKKAIGNYHFETISEFNPRAFIE